MMSNNPILALQDKKATDFIGGNLNIAIMLCLQNLTDLNHQISMPNSRAFQVKKDTVKATPSLYELYGVAKQLNDMNSNGSFPHALLDDNPNLKVLSSAQFLMEKIIDMIHQNIYFDPMYLNQYPNRAQLCVFLDQMWNEVRGFFSSRQAINSLTFHNRLVQTQCTENSRIVSRLLKKHERINVTKLSYLFTVDNNQASETLMLERGIMRIKSNFIEEIQNLNTKNLLCIQWRIQRTLYGQYYLNILIYHDKDHPLLHIPQGNFSRELNDRNGHTIKLTLCDPITGNLQVSTSGFQELNLAGWKAFFKIMVYPLRYYHYQSRIISPSFNNIIY